MKERPILFNAQMVRAILGGRKTQTRRVVRKQFAQDAEPAEVPATSPEGWQISGHSGLWWDDAGACIDDAIRCPFGKPGDRLWVRETWQAADGSKRAARIIESPRPDCGWIEYAATCDDHPPRWRPSIHMPRWASRILLEVTGVRVERLQEISVEDAIAEGVKRSERIPSLWNADYPDRGCGTAGDDGITAQVRVYRDLWKSINGPGSWDANPWVWVVEFKQLTGGAA